MTRLEAARTWLFLPGDRLDRLSRAYSSGAEVVVVDLEDAVTDTAKDDARAAVDAPVLDRARRLLAQADVSRTTSRGGLSSRNP